MRVWLALLLLIPVAAAHDGGVPFDPAADLFPDPVEVQEAILSAADTPGVQIIEVGTSQDGLPIRILVATHPDSDVPLSERVVTLIMSQQHGNEPAGTPAALAIIEQIKAQDGVWKYLDNQILILLPQINPDGSLDNRRTGEDGSDINRDHVALVTPEAKTLHRILNQYDVHLAMDHHEYGGVGLGYPSPVHVYDYDLTTMYPNHGNVREPTSDMALQLNYDFLYPYVRDRGYTIGDYGWTTIGVGNADPVQLSQTAGGPDPGILRNNYGLNNIVGLLVESFVQPAENPLASFERRVGGHLVVMEGVLQFGHENSAELIATKRNSEELNLNSPTGMYREGEVVVPMPGAYLFEAPDGGALELWAAHGLPAPYHNGSQMWLAHADHQRSGLVAAMLQPESSRHVFEGDPVVAVPSHPERRSAVDYGAALRGQVIEEPVLAVEPATETTPGPSVALLLGLLVAAIATARRQE